MTTNFPGDLRDYFAGQALAGLCADSHVYGAGVISTRAYEFADAMMAARATDELPPIDTSTGGIEPGLIDWSDPIELIADGTPLVVVRGPDKDGEYFVGREDGQRWEPVEKLGKLLSWYFNHRGELCDFEHLGPLIRNRREA